jgi:hypothetical protein
VGKGKFVGKFAWRMQEDEEKDIWEEEEDFNGEAHTKEAPAF